METTPLENMVIMNKLLELSGISDQFVVSKGYLDRRDDIGVFKAEDIDSAGDHETAPVMNVYRTPSGAYSFGVYSGDDIAEEYPEFTHAAADAISFFIQLRMTAYAELIWKDEVKKLREKS